MACDPTLLHMLIFGNKKQTSQKYYFLNNVGLQAKSQPLLSTNEKKCKMSVRTFLPRALQLIVISLKKQITFTKLQTEESHHEQGGARRNKLYKKEGSIR